MHKNEDMQKNITKSTFWEGLYIAPGWLRKDKRYIMCVYAIKLLQTLLTF